MRLLGFQENEVFTYSDEESAEEDWNAIEQYSKEFNHFEDEDELESESEESEDEKEMSKKEADEYLKKIINAWVDDLSSSSEETPNFDN